LQTPFASSFAQDNNVLQRKTLKNTAIIGIAAKRGQ